MEVRYAEAGDIGAIVDVVRRAQDALTATGSQQRLTLPSPDAVAAHIAARCPQHLRRGSINRTVREGCARYLGRHHDRPLQALIDVAGAAVRRRTP